MLKKYQCKQYLCLNTIGPLGQYLAFRTGSRIGSCKRIGILVLRLEVYPHFCFKYRSPILTTLRSVKYFDALVQDRYFFLISLIQCKPEQEISTHKWYRKSLTPINKKLRNYNRGEIVIKRFEDIKKIRDLPKKQNVSRRKLSKEINPGEVGKIKERWNKRSRK